MKFAIESGNTIETVTPAELAAAITKAEATWMARAVGVKWTETVNVPVSPPAGAATYQDNGPASGFAWKLRIIACTLQAAGQIAVFKGENIAGRPVQTAQSVAAAGLNIAVIFFPDDILVKSDQQLFISAGAGAILTYYRGAVQFPAEKEGQILS